jgi:hypothetical protein
MLVVAGCSSDADSKDASGSSSGSAPEAKKSPTVAPAKFAKLPDPCASIAKKTITDLVPGTKSKSGTAGKSSDIASRGNCSWNGLDDNGVKGSQYRWLDVSFYRYDSDASIGLSGEQRATEQYGKEISRAKATEDAKEVKTAPASGIGDEATTVNYKLKKTGEDFSYATIVARTANGVVVLTYNGTGYAGAKNPSTADLTKDALKAAKEAVTSVTTANKQ